MKKKVEKPDCNYENFASCNSSTNLYTKISELERELADCKSELCLKCGRYEHEFEGACDNCRWHNE